MHALESTVLKPPKWLKRKRRQRKNGKRKSLRNNKRKRKKAERAEEAKRVAEQKRQAELKAKQQAEAKRAERAEETAIRVAEQIDAFCSLSRLHCTAAKNACSFPNFLVEK